MKTSRQCCVACLNIASVLSNRRVCPLDMLFSDGPTSENLKHITSITELVSCRPHICILEKGSCAMQLASCVCRRYFQRALSRALRSGPFSIREATKCYTDLK